ncbi:MAG: TetR/AcrR family transcriptional regulator [Clostridia bacterium]|nr:TetR/AcrR family transcriptional regulator [Clostridia bacterium]
MDLRIQRTRKCIVDAFMEIRKKKDLEKITVKELADSAMINKATFYNHFSSVFDLSEQLENEAIDAVLYSIEPSEWLTGEATKRMALIMFEKADIFTTLFSGNRYGTLAYRLEEKIKQLIYQYRPQYEKDIEKDIVLTTMIHGCFHAAAKYRNFDMTKAIEIIAHINDCLIEEFKM